MRSFIKIPLKAQAARDGVMGGCRSRVLKKPRSNSTAVGGN